MRMWLSICSSLDEAQISAGTLRLKSVTSSGRSSTSRIITWHSGLFSRTPSAMSRSRVVLPVRGGATIRPRVPLPIGQKRSTARVVMRPSFISIFRCLSGETVVSAVNSSLARRSSMRQAVDRLDELASSGFGKRPSGGKAVPPISDAGLQLEAADQLLRNKRVGGPALAVLGEVEQLAVAALGRSMSRTPSTRMMFSGGGAGAGAAVGGGRRCCRGRRPRGMSGTAADARGLAVTGFLFHTKLRRHFALRLTLKTRGGISDVVTASLNPIISHQL